MDNNNTTKKYRRATIGSVFKSQSPDKSNYIKFNLGYIGGSLTLKDGQTLSVESKAFQMQSLKKAIAEGKLSGENAEKAMARVEKIPDFILGEIVLVEKL